jgi:hypothetical protein
MIIIALNRQKVAFKASRVKPAHLKDYLLTIIF